MSADFESINTFARKNLSLPRYLHSLRTAETAAKLARRFNLNVPEARIAGMAHDIARELPGHEISMIAMQDGMPILSEELKSPVLLHGRAGAVLLQSMWGEERETILRAVRRHTQGDIDMGETGMLLYIADYIEPGRSHVSENYRQGILQMKNVEQMVLIIAQDQIKYLEQKEKHVSARTIRLVNRLMEARHVVLQG